MSKINKIKGRIYGIGIDKELQDTDFGTKYLHWEYISGKAWAPIKKKIK
jgi:hypothetical protein